MDHQNGFATGDVFDFDAIIPIVKVVKCANKEYELRQATEEAHIAYEGQRRKGSSILDGGRIQLAPESAEADLVLVSRCLYDGNNKQVHITQLRQWPHHFIEKMADWVRENTPGMSTDTRKSIEAEISKLQERLARMEPVQSLEVQAKNSSNAT